MEVESVASDLCIASCSDRSDVGTGIGLFYTLFSIPEPEGLSLADWPNRFTDNFSIWMKNDKGTLQIEDIGLERLDEYGLWLQVMMKPGRKCFPIISQGTFLQNMLRLN